MARTKHMAYFVCGYRGIDSNAPPHSHYHISATNVRQASNFSVAAIIPKPADRKVNKPKGVHVANPTYVAEEEPG